jgi:hypothetical protein
MSQRRWLLLLVLATSCATAELSPGFELVETPSGKMGYRVEPIGTDRAILDLEYVVWSAFPNDMKEEAYARKSFLTVAERVCGRPVPLPLYELDVAASRSMLSGYYRFEISHEIPCAPAEDGS